MFAVAGIALASSGTAPVTVDFRKLIGRADIEYSEPASRSEEGLPVGNGRTGTLVWTTPSALKMQINRVDVFACDASSVSFPGPDTDYGSGCGFVDINVVDAGDDVFVGKPFRQHLSMYDGMMTVAGQGFSARILAWHRHDVIAVELNDQRTEPATVNVDLRMLRFATECIYGESYNLAQQHKVRIRTAEHSATSQLLIDDGTVVLTQEFREHQFFNSSAVAVRIVGRPSKARFLNESTLQLSALPGNGRFKVLIASACTQDSAQSVAALALRELAAATGETFDAIAQDNATWWEAFWSKGFVHLHSASGQADFVEQNYTYFLYLMASSSLGKYPPRFGGLVWNTNGDMRRWGSQYWWANTSAYYSNLMPCNRMQLMDPMFSMYSNMLPSCAVAARQQWGSRGIWIPEIVAFDGMETLPEDIASELQDLVLVRKPYEKRSARFQWYVETKTRHHARWNFQDDGSWVHGHFVVPTKGDGIFGHCTHILGAGARIARLYWERYLFTNDTSWLRDRAYPLIRGSVEFYRNFPNLNKEADGRYHIHHVNNGESDWNSSDTPYEVSAMRMIFPIAIAASVILNTDDSLRTRWQEIADNLVQLPERPSRSRSSRGGYGAFVYGGPGAIEPVGPEPDLKRMFLNFNRTGGFVDATGIGGAKIFRNRLRLREGPGAIDAEHIGGLASGIHSSLLADTSRLPEATPVIQVFPSWPRDWDADFTLLAHGGFIVTASQRGGKIRFVSVMATGKRVCRLKNPWGESGVTLHRGTMREKTFSGSVLEFAMHRDDHVLIVLEGIDPSSIQENIP